MHEANTQIRCAEEMASTASRRALAASQICPVDHSSPDECLPRRIVSTL
jgi:hypothetical protein